MSATISYWRRPGRTALQKLDISLVGDLRGARAPRRSRRRSCASSSLSTSAVASSSAKPRAASASQCGMKRRGAAAAASWRCDQAARRPRARYRRRNARARPRLPLRRVRHLRRCRETARPRRRHRPSAIAVTLEDAEIGAVAQVIALPGVAVEQDMIDARLRASPRRGAGAAPRRALICCPPSALPLTLPLRSAPPPTRRSRAAPPRPKRNRRARRPRPLGGRASSDRPSRRRPR